ncbi:MAG: glucose 1-dehydrogenase [Caldilineaceae bacterium]|nr:glucose 1-dehydrogenase [Caldilineaceae bacterium]
MNAKNPFDLTGKVALVTGASRGIGAAVAQAFAQAGAQVVLASRKQEPLDALAAEIRAAGGTALAVAAHTGDDAAVEALVARAVDECGGVDILVNNAATNPHYGPVLTAEDGHWDKTFDVNVKGYVRMVRACMAPMQARGGGAVINVASIAGIKPETGMGVYAVSKAGVLMLTQVLAVELAPANIRVNAVAPGYVKTKFSSVIWQNPHVYAAVKARIPQGRMAEPEELTGVMLYLASDAASFTTGAVFTVDGGHLLG